MRLQPGRHVLCVDTLQAKRTAVLDAAPARFLDQSEELRMELSNEQLICEAVECNHAGVGSSTLERYRDHLSHFAQYLASVHKSDFYKANKKQVRLFMGHLEKQGGENPDPARLRCEWCRTRGYPEVEKVRGGRRPTARATGRRCGSSTTTFRPMTSCPTSTRPSWSHRPR